MYQLRHNSTLARVFFSTILTVVFSICLASSTHAATLFLSPATPNVSVGNIVSIKVLVSTGGKAINSADGTVQFPANLLEVLSISKSSSIFSLWVEEPKFTNSDGSIIFSGGLPTPGFTGEGGEILSITFRAKQAGNASIIFSDGSVRQNDGLGTDILFSKLAAQLSISTPVLVTPVTDEQEVIIAGAPKAPIVTSSTHPDQNRWYQDQNPVFSWGVPSDVTAVRLQYDRNVKATPLVTYSSSITEKKLSNVPDGTYYFHAQFKNSHGWGGIAHYRFNIDTTPPDRFAITEAHPDNSDDPRPILYFNTKDGMSGMDHYNIKIGNDDFLTVLADSVLSNPYTPATQESGNKTIVVKAYDKAGNVTTASTDIEIKAIDAPVITDYPSEIQEGDILRILGKSYPNSTVTIALKDQSGVQVSQISKTTLMGDFDVTWTHRLSTGLYTFTAKVTNDKGAVSSVSIPYTVSVKVGTLYQAGYLVINYLSLSLIVIISLGLIIAAIMLLYHKLTRFRRKIRRVVSDTEHTLHHRFDQLEKDVVDQLNKLESAKSKRQLTKEEKDIFDTFHKYIQTTEKELDTMLEQLKKDAE